MDRDEILRVLRAFEEIEEMNAVPVRSSAQADFDRFPRHCARYWAIAPRTPRALGRV